jgi:hypothetical protein
VKHAAITDSSIDDVVAPIEIEALIRLVVRALMAMRGARP